MKNLFYLIISCFMLISVGCQASLPDIPKAEGVSDQTAVVDVGFTINTVDHIFTEYQKQLDFVNSFYIVAKHIIFISVSATQTIIAEVSIIRAVPPDRYQAHVNFYKNNKPTLLTWLTNDLTDPPPLII